MANRGPTYRLRPDFEEKLDKFVDRFLDQGFETFADEFVDLDSYIAKAEADRSKRNYHSLRRTKRELYLLAAVTYRLHDRLNREEFNRAKDTVIIMPDCLTLHNPDCLKTDEPYGDLCQNCTPDCQANGICELADEYGITAVFSKRKLSEQIEHFADRSGDLGVIGIGCILMLAEGMRSAHDVKVPARGVPLDFCGCEHWNDEPFASEFQLEALRAILEEKYGQRDQATDH